MTVKLNQPRCTLSAVATPDNLFIYVFGGFDNGPLDDVERSNEIHIVDILSSTISGNHVPVC